MILVKENTRNVEMHEIKLSGVVVGEDEKFKYLGFIEQTVVRLATIYGMSI